MFHRITLIGFVGADPALRYTEDGTPVTNFSVATRQVVSKERVAQFIASADACLVHLRDTELFGTVLPSKIFEIMDAGVPIIMGVRGEARDIVVDHDAGVEMTPDCGDSLLQCIDTIAARPLSYRSGRDFVGHAYNRDKLAQRMLVVLMHFAGATISIPEFAASAEDVEVAPSRRAA